MPKFFRTPKNGEWIEYDCGCIYEIRKTPKMSKHAFEVEDESMRTK